MEEAIGILRNILGSPAVINTISNAISTAPQVNSTLNTEIHNLFRPDRNAANATPMPSTTLETPRFHRNGANATPMPPTTLETPRFQARRFSRWNSRGKEKKR